MAHISHYFNFEVGEDVRELLDMQDFERTIDELTKFYNEK